MRKRNVYMCIDIYMYIYAYIHIDIFLNILRNCNDSPQKMLLPESPSFVLIFSLFVRNFSNPVHSLDQQI